MSPIPKKGMLAWMAQNPVAANLLMLFLVLGGLAGALTTKQEVFPEFEIDLVTVSVPYPGASPLEVEQGINLAIEERLRSLDGVKEVRSNAYESMGVIRVELLRGANPDQVLADVKGEVDRVTTLPQETEEPVINLIRLRRDVVSLVISGDQPLSTLHEIGERARMDLLAKKGVTQVDMSGIPPLEISVEIDREQLEQHELTLRQVADTIAQSSLELAAGGLETANGELLVRVADRRQRGHELASLVVKTSLSGGEVTLGEIATITDGFEDRDRYAFFNGKPAVRLTAYRVGDQTPKGVAKTVRDYADKLRKDLPGNIEVSIWSDKSEVLQARIDLLAKNALMGSFLVLGILALFLDLRLAFWVALGIPISFLGSFLFLSPSDVSINMITLFAFIVTLGMVVDDAIVVGERIFSLISEGIPGQKAAIQAAQELAAPISFAIFTSVAAFAPMLFVPGVMGKIFKMIPTVVIAVLLISLLESFLILPAHLSHTHRQERPRFWIARVFLAMQTLVNQGLAWVTTWFYRPLLKLCLRYRYITMALGVCLLIGTAGVVKSGRVPFNFFPQLAGNEVRFEVQLPYGAPIQETKNIQTQVEKALNKTLNEYQAQDKQRGIFTDLGAATMIGGDRGGAEGSHFLSVRVLLVPSDERDFDSDTFAKSWEKNAGTIVRADAVLVSAATGPGAGSAISLLLSHPDNEVLNEVSVKAEQLLRDFPQLNNISNQYSSGKPQMSYSLDPSARALGLTASNVARQLRDSFYGAQAIREQRGRNELKIMVRLPEHQRSSEYDLENLRIQTPAGAKVKLGEVAQLTRGRAATSIMRENGHRTLTVSAELKAGVKSPRPVLDALNAGKLDELKKAYPGLEISFSGAQREQAETFGSLQVGLVLALFAIYALLAIPFRSYIQPVIIMAVIPFGIVGAVLGHILLGYSLSMLSIMGMVALSGVVVNDSIVLIDAVNRRRAAGDLATQALITGSISRIRPILLTSLTTFFGLAPMLSETSVQARFLIPMAISLGYGVLFATVVVLVCVPAMYLIVDDLQRGLRALTKLASQDPQAPAE